MDIFLSLFTDINSQNNRNGETALHAASRLGYDEIVKFLLEKGADDTRVDFDDHTPPQLALFNNHSKVLNTFLNHDGNVVRHSDTEQRTLLWHASQMGLPNMVKLLLEKNADPNSVSADRMTPFNVAVYNGHVNVTKVFLELTKIDLNIEQFDDFYPLTYAARADQVSMGEFLIGMGANISLARKDGKPLLMSAVEFNNINFIDFLLNQNVDINEQAVHGQTSLNRASFLGYIDIVKLLVEKGNANLTIRDQAERTALTQAVQFGHLDIVQYLLEKGESLNDDEDLSNLVGVTIILGHIDLLKLLLQKVPRDKVMADDPVHQAIFQNRLDIVKIFVEDYNVSPNIRELKEDNFTLETPALSLAAIKGSYEICVYLVEQGANIEATNKIGVTPLHAACSSGNNDIIKFLLEKKAYIEAKTDEGLTPLHIAAQDGHLEAVNILLQFGADINSRWEINNYTPLISSAGNKHFDISEFLIESGADLDVAETDLGRTASHFCAIQGGFQCVKKLIEHGADPEIRNHLNWTTIFFAVSKNQFDIAKYLVEDVKVNLNLLDNAGFSPLHWAVNNRNFEMLDLLVANGADPNIQSEARGSPLHEVITHHDLEMVKYLVGIERVDVELPNEFGYTPLFWAIANRNVETVKILVEFGNADIEAKDPGGKFSALQFVILDNKPDMAEYLLEKGAQLIQVEAVALLNNIGKNERMAKILLKWIKKMDINESSFYLSIQHGFLDVVKLFIETGAIDVNTVEYERSLAPLHFAVLFNQVDIAKYLLENGANVNEVNSKFGGESAMTIAAQKGNIEMIKLLVENGAKITK